MELSHVRKEYSESTLRKKDLSHNPFEEFKKWLHAAKEDPEPNAMQLATTVNDRPSLRTVLLKEVNEKGFIFFTHTESRKGKEILKNPNVSLLFLWKEMERQIIIEGKAEPVSKEKAHAYFEKRPRKSQLGSAASVQDAHLASKEELIKAYEALTKKFEGRQVEPPEDWGGYLVKPTRFEFWQGSEARLHDRFEYVPKDNGWRLQRLSP
ncbi:MAG: pyridoxamine 5'-phosphate oxidase [Chlamydiia bacterium]|nr:pyridoxamine 5'-phosphate oxidase [Chlamydiia bacterium]